MTLVTGAQLSRVLKHEKMCVCGARTRCSVFSLHVKPSFGPHMGLALIRHNPSDQEVRPGGLTRHRAAWSPRHARFHFGPTVSSVQKSFQSPAKMHPLKCMVVDNRLLVQWTTESSDVEYGRCSDVKVASTEECE